MNLIETLKLNKPRFVIYGAQVVACGAYTAIHHLCGCTPEFFAVSSLENNPNDIDGIQVRPYEFIPKDVLIVVAVTELLQDAIVSHLKTKGYEKIFILTQNEEHILMSEYFKSIGKFQSAIEFENYSEFPSDFVLYEVRNHRDKELSYPPELMSYEKTIQAGAGITDIKIADITDDTGINISEKNKMYCELTATYWVWKNTNHSWCGIEHYRRHLLVESDMFNVADAILPLPYICYPNTLAQFRRFVNEDVCNLLLRALKDLHPNKYKEYIEILYGNYQYTYNIFCAKKEVFDDYCAWFFNITEYIEKISSDFPVIKETRALSYVAEVLTNLYFMSNKNRIRIIHTAKRIFV